MAQPSWLRVASLSLLVVLLLSRIAAVHSEAVNWDEFALLTNAAQTAATGELHAGGRPGLAVLMLLPFVSECHDEMASVHAARLLWLAFTVAMLAGLAMLLFQLGEGRASRDRSLDVLLGLGLLALVPAFVQTSIQVRSDQIALAAGLWAGCALLGSRRRPWLALLAGLLFGLGYLASQKLLYVGALVALLAAGQLWLRGGFELRRELLRTGLVALAGVAVLASFAWMVGLLFPSETAGGPAAASMGSSFTHGIGAFAFYRKTIGWSQYRDLAPSLLPHALLVGLLLYVTPALLRQGGEALRRVALAWAVLGLGLAVGLFHAAAFAYFWMTLGLFPAAAFALARRPIAERMPGEPRAQAAAGAALAALILVPGLMQGGFMLADSQANQRASLAFIQRNFDARDVGFHPEGALFCRLAEPAFPIWFSQHIYAYFGREEDISRQSTAELIEDFESRQVKFLLESFRLSQFPGPVRQFWLDNYQPYRGSVLVAGRYFTTDQPASDFELLVDGEYRWIPLEQPRPLRVDGSVVPPGGRIQLRRGPHHRSDSVHGYLVLALAEPPGDAERPFYPIQ